MTDAQKKQHVSNALWHLEQVYAAVQGAETAEEGYLADAIAKARLACPTCPSPSNPPPA